ncbi:hypothetical protein GEMRC1_002113 [Eukaryota sp. GEM-RC1]
MSKVTDALALDPKGNYHYEILEPVQHTISRKWAQDYCDAHGIKHYGNKAELIQRVLDHAAGKKVQVARRYGKRAGNKATPSPAPNTTAEYTITEEYIAQGPRSIEATTVPALLPLDCFESPLLQQDFSKISPPVKAPSGTGYIANPNVEPTDLLLSNPHLQQHSSRRFIFPSKTAMNRIQDTLNSTYRILSWPKLTTHPLTHLSWMVEDEARSMVSQVTIGQTYQCDCNSTLFPCNHIVFVLTKTLFMGHDHPYLWVTGLLNHEVDDLAKRTRETLDTDISFCPVCCGSISDHDDVISRCRHGCRPLHRFCLEKWSDFKMRSGLLLDCPLCLEEM